MEWIKNYFRPYINRRISSMLLLYISSGLPLLLVGSTLQAWYTVSGVDLLTIGILTLVGQPYAYKVFWAPLLDRFVPLKLGRRRSWIFLMQFCLAISLSVMAVLNPAKTPWLLAMIALVVACFSASQDIAIDAYRTDLLSPQERGMGAAMVSLGYRIGMLIAGAFALILAAEIGWRITYFIMAGIMIVGMGVTLLAPSPSEELTAPRSLAQAFVLPLKEFFSRRNAFALLVFIIIYKLCDAFALSLSTTFLIRGVGFSLIDVGAITKSVGLLALIIGGLFGGAIMPRIGLYRGLMYFGFLQAASNLLFALLAIVGKNYLVMTVTIFAENFCSGLSTVAFVVLLTALCNKHYTATQYALFSALSAVGRIFVGPAAAIIVNHIGWEHFFIWSFFIGIPSLLLLWWLRYRVDFSQEEIAGTS